MDYRHDLTWEEKARRNPLYAVMATDDFADKGPFEWTDQDLAAFFSKGQLIFDTWLAPIMAASGIVKGARVIEYGSGMGRILKAVAAAGFRCAGIDISQTMLANSRLLVPEVADLSPLEGGRSHFFDREADCVYSHAVLHHIQTLSQVTTALLEMVRLLRPGGLLIVHARLFGIREAWAKNWERWSLLFGSKQIGRLRIPGCMLVKHTHWVGVPLARAEFESILARGDTHVSAYRAAPNRHFYWAVAARRQPS